MLETRPSSKTYISRLLLGGVLVALFSVFLVYFFYCPCERTPGGWLLGTEESTPVRDWSFANQAPLCQIQVQRLLPHSVNLNCMSANGDLYLSCARCEGKTWSTYALSNPKARLRIGGTIYPVNLARVTDETKLDIAWQARAKKFARPAIPRQPDWWSFQAQSYNANRTL